MTDVSFGGLLRDPAALLLQQQRTASLPPPGGDLRLDRAMLASIVPMLGRRSAFPRSGPAPEMPWHADVRWTLTEPHIEAPLRAGKEPLGMDAVSVADLLHEAAETHHRVYRITDGTDPDWASWYADWLIEHSELPTLLDAMPVRSELVYLLVLLDKEYSRRPPTEPWERYYSDRIAEHFSS